MVQFWKRTNPPKKKSDLYRIAIIVSLQLQVSTAASAGQEKDYTRTVKYVYVKNTSLILAVVNGSVRAERRDQRH